MKPSRLFWLWGLAGCFSVSLINPNPSLAQKAPRSLNRLPAPPSVPNSKNPSSLSSQPNPKPLPTELTPVAPASSPPIREYVFKSPSAEETSPSSKSTPPSSPYPRATVTEKTTQPVTIATVTEKTTQPVTILKESNELYRVEVTGESESVLAKVKAVEPLAFVRVGEGAIYAGLFQQQKQAQQRVQELTNKGLSAKVVKLTDQGIQKNVPSQRLISP